MKKSNNDESVTDFFTPKYNIGELSNILDIHQQTIRFFEQNKIITPYRTESGIRKYSIHDAYFLQLRKCYDNLGFSLSDTSDIFKHSTINDLSVVFKKAKDNLVEKTE